MKQIKKAFPYLVLIIGLILLFKKCNSIEISIPSIADLLSPPTIDTIYLKPDTIVNERIIEKLVPKIVYKDPSRDTIIKIPTAKDTLFVNVPYREDPFIPEINIYQDSINEKEFQLSYTIVARGEMLSFNPIVSVYAPKMQITRTKRSLFLVNPVVGFTVGPEDSFAYGLNVGYGSYTAAWIKHGSSNMFLAGYQLKF